MAWFTKIQQKEDSSRGSRLSDAEARQQRNFITAFSILARLAKADGKISKAEADTINDLMKNVLALDEPRQKFAAQVFNDAKNSDKDVVEFAQEYKEANRNNPELYEWLIEILLRVSYADGQFSESEEKIVETVRKVLGVSDASFSKLKGQYRSNLDEHYVLLGCKPGDTIETITAAYNKMVEKYEPNKMQEMGVPEEFQTLAEEKVKRIKKAYQEILEKDLLK